MFLFRQNILTFNSICTSYFVRNFFQLCSLYNEIVILFTGPPGPVGPPGEDGDKGDIEYNI